MFLAKVLKVVVVAGTLVVLVELKAAASVVEAGEVVCSSQRRIAQCFIMDCLFTVFYNGMCY